MEQQHAESMATMLVITGSIASMVMTAIPAGTIGAILRWQKKTIQSALAPSIFIAIRRMIPLRNTATVLSAVTINALLNFRKILFMQKKAHQAAALHGLSVPAGAAAEVLRMQLNIRQNVMRLWGIIPVTVLLPIWIMAHTVVDSILSVTLMRHRWTMKMFVSIVGDRSAQEMVTEVLNVVRVVTMLVMISIMLNVPDVIRDIARVATMVRASVPHSP